MIMRVGIMFLVIGLVAVGPAWAADEAGQAATGGAAATTFRWGGFYIGGNGGFGWNSYNSTTTNTVNGSMTPTSSTNNGAVGGGQLGFNFVVGGPWIVGAQADVDATTISKDTTSENAAGVTTASSTSSAKAIGTVRGAIGIAANAVLLSATGGLAWHRVDASRTQLAGRLNNATAGTGEDNLYTSAGWTVGGELAAGLHDHWVVKGEYLYLHFDHTITTPLSLLSTTTTGHLQMVRAGVNYVFN
jgi:outer membrane immunogenic protein